MRLRKFLNFSKVLKNFLEHPYYFCIKRIFWKRFIPTTFVFSYFLLKRIIPTTFVVSLVLLEKKLFKDYQIFSERSPKFQKLFRKQTYRFLWNIYPWFEDKIPKMRFISWPRSSNNDVNDWAIWIQLPVYTL